MNNFYVPENTKKYKFFAEAVTHPFLELGVDDTVRQEYPTIEDDATYYLSDENIEEFCVGYDSIIQRASGNVLSESGWECKTLASVVAKGGFYQQVFLIGPVLNWGYKAFIKFADFLPSPTWQPYEDNAKEMTRQTLQDMWPRQYDPVGYEALRLSEFGWWVLRALIILVLVGLIVRIGWKVVKG